MGAFKAGIIKKLGADHPLAAQLSELQQDLAAWSTKTHPELAGTGRRLPNVAMGCVDVCQNRNLLP